MNKESANQLTVLPNIAPPKRSSITFHLNKVNGIGPSGFMTNEIGTIDTYKNSTETELKEEFKGYPLLKNKPDNLKNVVEYFYVLDNAQFYYQNYVTGIYSKSLLIQKFKDFKIDLSDTVKLSREPLKCYISVLGGFKDNEPVYIVDADNDGDYANDVLKPLLKDTHDESLVIASSTPVSITYLYNGQIKGGTRTVFMQQSRNPKKFAMTFSFPEFRYMRFKYKGQPYMICSEGNTYLPFYTVVPDRPYFVSLNRANAIKPGQFAQIGGDNFMLSSVTDNASEITLVGSDISGFNSNQIIKTTNTKPTATTIISRQLGFKAPSIKGINVTPGSKSGTTINTNDLKGKYIFIDFWSTSCGPCIEEFAKIKEVYSKFNKKNFEIIGVADERSKDALVKILKEHHILWPNIKTDTITTQINGYEDINSYPTTYLLDPSGKIIAVDLRNEALMNKLKTLITL
ncbi:TlpA family protein disulfide reductase [Mucilaginibacter boryungensis]|uniref:TlpA family protein disulfide reductase n=1 Tax=Mucilaginibacter boryungensis TaxID=768480 RepID=UPI00366EB651